MLLRAITSPILCFWSPSQVESSLFSFNVWTFFQPHIHQRISEYFTPCTGKRQAGGIWSAEEAKAAGASFYLHLMLQLILEIELVLILNLKPWLYLFVLWIDCWDTEHIFVIYINVSKPAWSINVFCNISKWFYFPECQKCAMLPHPVHLLMALELNFPFWCLFLTHDELFNSIAVAVFLIRTDVRKWNSGLL